jgi:hypothetical protein
MSYFAINSPYFQEIIRQRNLLWITQPLSEGGLNQEAIPLNLLLPYADEDILFTLLRKTARKSFADLNAAIHHFYRYKRNFLNIILQLQTSQVNICLSDLVQKMNKKPTQPIVLDFPVAGKYSFSFFTAKCDTLFIYTLSHLLQDQIDNIKEKAQKIRDNSSNNYLDIDNKIYLNPASVNHRNYVSLTHKFVSDNLFIGETLDLYLKYPEILIKFEEEKVPDNEKISCLSFEIKIRKEIRSQVWRKFFQEKGIISFTGKCFICNQPIQYDNWKPCFINDKMVHADNLLPCCVRCSTLITKNISAYLIDNSLYHNLAAKYLGIISPVHFDASYQSSIAISRRSAYISNSMANLSSVPPFRY